MCYHISMGKRLNGFDYSSPYFYMVTLRRTDGYADFSTITGDPSTHFIHASPLTHRLSKAIRTFHTQWKCLHPIECFSIMPDHIHLILKILPTEKRATLPLLVWQLMRSLERVYLEDATLQTPPNTPTPSHLFLPDWHDWIITKREHLTVFTHYIRENPMRRWQRLTHAQNFQRIQNVTYRDHQWFAYGNPTLLNHPIIEGFQCSRKWKPTDTTWQEAIEKASRLGPGCVGISTFMSPCEKACGNEIFKAGGSLIILHPEGFHDRWHPTRSKETLCAQGRLLFLSLYPASTHKLTAAELYQRCHTMGDIVK